MIHGRLLLRDWLITEGAQAPLPLVDGFNVGGGVVAVAQTFTSATAACPSAILKGATTVQAPQPLTRLAAVTEAPHATLVAVKVLGR